MEFEKINQVTQFLVEHLVLQQLFKLHFLYSAFRSEGRAIIMIPFSILLFFYYS